MRLLGDPTEKAIVEVYDGFNWGRVCELEFIEDAFLICRHFGYKTALANISIPIERGKQRSKIFQMGYCSGGELQQCDSEIYPSCLCREYEAGVICSEGKKSTKLSTISVTLSMTIKFKKCAIFAEYFLQNNDNANFNPHIPQAYILSNIFCYKQNKNHGVVFSNNV